MLRNIFRYPWLSVMYFENYRLQKLLCECHCHWELNRSPNSIPVSTPGKTGSREKFSNGKITYQIYSAFYVHCKTHIFLWNSLENIFIFNWEKKRLAKFKADRTTDNYSDFSKNRACMVMYFFQKISPPKTPY